MNTTSSLYQELSAQELILLIEQNFCVSLKNAKLLSGGMFNTTYLIEYGKPLKKAVLRLGPVNRHLLLPFEENLMEAENYVYQLCDERNIPASKVLVCDTSKALINRDYMIVEYIESIPLSDEQINECDKKILYEKTGEYAAMLHAVTGEKFGRVSGLLKGKSYEKWSDFFLSEISEWIGKSREFQVFSEETMIQILSVYEKYRDLLDEVKLPHLIHADIWAGNVLVQQKNSHYEFAALIDADRAIFGDVDYEFATPWMVNDDFIRGYHHISNREVDVQLNTKKKLYLLFCHLTDAYVLKVEYNNLEAHQSMCKEMLKLLQELI